MSDPTPSARAPVLRKQRALKAGAREVATQAIDRAGELELGVSRRMLKLTVLAASEARDLESVQKCVPPNSRPGAQGICLRRHLLLR